MGKGWKSVGISMGHTVMAHEGHQQGQGPRPCSTEGDREDNRQTNRQTDVHRICPLYDDILS